VIEAHIGSFAAHTLGGGASRPRREAGLTGREARQASDG
jgi:hypothetical protein